MRALVKLLKKGGHIILTTPNKSYYSTDAIWSGENPPVHCWWFSEDSMEYIAKELDMSIKFVDYSNAYQVRMSSAASTEPSKVGPRLDMHGVPIEKNNKESLPQYGIFPKWFKKSYLYQVSSQTIYPLVAKLFYPSNQKRTIALCAIFTK